ncbi:hypothetical protein GUJ93_ZPchr0011g28016 [Zizania palustris]|uniref:Uncharacterized protein n=1 Tax=Zizania palustris TaxID=103762 RepID=A0A8J5WGI4_ZIZPA|nr:hypothetical protein GUJ93_ZPchr0011g28016 [Zizania palustris]
MDVPTDPVKENGDTDDFIESIEAVLTSTSLSPYGAKVPRSMTEPITVDLTKVPLALALLSIHCQCMPYFSMCPLLLTTIQLQPISLHLDFRVVVVTSQIEFLCSSYHLI